MEMVLEYMAKNYRKVLGSLFGFIFAMLIVIFGFFQALLVLILTVGGYLFGEAIFRIDLRKWIVEKLTEGEDKE